MWREVDQWKCVVSCAVCVCVWVFVCSKRGAARLTGLARRGVKHLIPLARVYEILAAVREQVLLAGNVVLHGRCDLARVNVEAVLPLLGEADVEGNNVVVRHLVGYVFRQSLLLNPIFVQSRHKVCQRA